MDYEIKKRKNKKNKVRQISKIYFYVTKFLFVVLLTLVTMIALKSNSTFKHNFYKQVYEKNISFTTINKYYQKYFGKPLPFQKLFESKIETVFNEKLEYTESNIYKDGVSLSVTQDYMVPILQNGMITFIGNKEEYGNTIIIEQLDGIEVWYCNIKNESVKMYDYVTKGDFLGNAVDSKLYLVFKKDGKVLDYKKYIS